MTGYRIQIPPTTELHRKEIELRIRQLVDFHREMGLREIWFDTVDDIVKYLNDTVGVRQRGLRITKYAISRWHKRLGFPLYKPKSNETHSSNVLIMAWLWAFRVYKASQRKDAVHAA